jgi:hypothetical protein
LKVILIVEIVDLGDKVLFEKHLKKEGFSPIENEEFAYEGETTTHMYSTRAYILEVMNKGLRKTSFLTCKIIFQVGENPLEAYLFDKKTHDFQEIKV